MKKNILSKITVSLALAFILALPHIGRAATIYLESSNTTISVGDTAVISVKINADGEVLNTVDGTVMTKSGLGNFAVKEFSLANSAFGLWPRTPSLSTDGKTISFVGGVPGGFSIEGATIFKIIVEAQKEGSITLSPQNMIVYANDGKATQVKVTSKDIVLSVAPKKTGEVVKNDWDTVLAADTIAPEDFIVVMGQDASLYEGKKFAFFSAVDNQSGVSYYEVSENGGAVVKSGSTYVPVDQGDDVKLSVTAYDKAGNTKTASYPSSATSSSVLWWVVGLIIVLALGYFVWKKKQRKFDAPRTF